MELLLSVVSAIEVVPTLIRVAAVLGLVAGVFYTFKGTTSRAASFCAILVFFAAQFSPPDELLASLIAYGALGLGGALAQEALIRFGSDTGSYLSPDLLSLPLWVFPLAAIVSMVVANLYPALMTLLDKALTVLKTMLEEYDRHQRKLHKN
tara:strand:- start:29 stop:481 length:453 start_codon:yes stop_codon:yes gene_type:complete